MKNLYRTAALGTAAAMLLALGACSAGNKGQLREVGTDESFGRQAPGVVEYVWEEPMVDVVEVPPGLDPEGHYYRPAHQSIVEIRQGRWQYHGDK